MSGTDSIFGTIVDTISEALNIIKEIINFITAIISGDWSGAWDSIKNIASSVWNIISGLIGSAINNIKNVLSSVLNGIKSVVSSAMDTIKSTFSAAWDNVKSKVSTAFNNVKSTISSAMTTIKSTISNIVTNIKSQFTNLANKAKTWAKDMMANFIQGIKDKINAVGDACKGVASKVKSFLGFSLPDEGPLADADTYMPDFMGLLAEGIEGNEDKVIDSVEELAGRVADSASFEGGDVDIEGATYQPANDDRLSQLLDLLNQYLPMLADMDVVLDSGELVGATAQKMNSELGRISAKEARRG